LALENIASPKVFFLDLVFYDFYDLVFYDLAFFGLGVLLGVLLLLLGVLLLLLGVLLDVFELSIY